MCVTEACHSFAGRNLNIEAGININVNGHNKDLDSRLKPARMTRKLIEDHIYHSRRK